MSKNYFIIPIFVPHTGCPNDCVFCNQRKITGKSTDMTSEEIIDRIESYLETIPSKDRTVEIAFFGGSFTGIDLDIQAEFLDIAYSYKKRGIIDKIRLSTRPDYIDKQRLDLLKSRQVDIIELGVQSMDEEVLEKSYRGHSVEDVKCASALIKEYGFTLGLQMMVGLPGDTREKSLKTTEMIISLSPSIVRIYPTLVIKDTELEREFKSGRYSPLSLEEAVYRSKVALCRFEMKGIKVIRVGLQPSDNISEDGDIVAGPFHPAFRQLVESEIYYDIIDYVLSGIKDLKGKSIVISAGKSEISNVSGQKGKNKSRLIKKHGLKKMNLVSENRERGTLALTIGNEIVDIVKRDMLLKLYLKT